MRDVSDLVEHPSGGFGDAQRPVNQGVASLKGEMSNKPDGPGKATQGPTGPVPGNIFATITENFEAMALACDSIWREGFVGEQLVYRRMGERPAST